LHTDYFSVIEISEMADKVQEKDEKNADGGENSENAQDNKKSAKNSKKKLLIIILPLILVIGGVVGLYFSGLSEKLFGKIKPAEETEEVVDDKPKEAPPKDVPQAVAGANIAFYDLPEMLVNINTNSRKQSYLKTVITLELGDGNQIPKLEAVLPRVIDTFQVYLRELRIDDLQGSAGMYRLKEELLDRLNKAAYPVQVNDVLFKEMLVQ